MVAPPRDFILGSVEVAGEVYQLSSLGQDCYAAIRMTDSHCVGIVGASGWMWRLQSEMPELMQEIIQAAMVNGLVQAPPAD